MIRWPRRALVALVDLYRRFLSPLLPPLCRFEPSCSAYARQALVSHGALKGAALALWRVLRCNPLTQGGTYDPVPPCGGAAPEVASGESRRPPPRAD